MLERENWPMQLVLQPLPTFCDTHTHTHSVMKITIKPEAVVLPYNPNSQGPEEENCYQFEGHIGYEVPDHPGIWNEI